MDTRCEAQTTTIRMSLRPQFALLCSAATDLRRETQRPSAQCPSGSAHGADGEAAGTDDEVAACTPPVLQLSSIRSNPPVAAATVAFGPESLK